MGSQSEKYINWKNSLTASFDGIKEYWLVSDPEHETIFVQLLIDEAGIISSAEVDTGEKTYDVDSSNFNSDPYVSTVLKKRGTTQ